MNSRRTAVAWAAVFLAACDNPPDAATGPDASAGVAGSGSMAPGTWSSVWRTTVRETRRPHQTGSAWS